MFGLLLLDSVTIRFGGVFRGLFLSKTICLDSALYRVSRSEAKIRVRARARLGGHVLAIFSPRSCLPFRACFNRQSGATPPLGEARNGLKFGASIKRRKRGGKGRPVCCLTSAPVLIPQTTVGV